LAIYEGEEKVLAFAYCFYAAGIGSTDGSHRGKCIGTFHLRPILIPNRKYKTSPFVRTATAEAIFEKLTRFSQYISEKRHYLIISLFDKDAELYWDAKKQKCAKGIK